MNDIIKNLIFLTQDQITFWILQGILLLVFAYAFVRSKYEVYRSGKGGVSLILKRGEKSMGYFHHFASGFISVIIAVIISVADTAYSHKVFIFLVDVIIVLYLSYWNGWSKNKLVGIYSQIEQKEEKR